ncbi:MAG: cupin-like domain-containing protein [Cellvibrionaceae bacterium]|nr:cupin-like domain-containing protein [Cellvibrionaceae bacterium]
MSEVVVANKVEAIEGFNADNIPGEIFISDKPVLLKGVVTEWPLVKAGLESTASAIEFLKKRYSGKPAAAYFADANTGGYLSYNRDVSQLNFKTHRADLHMVLDELLEFSCKSNSPVRYIPSNIAEVFFPGVREEHELSFNKECFVNVPMVPGDPLYGIWIGNQTTSPATMMRSPIWPAVWLARVDLRCSRRSRFTTYILGPLI